MTIRPEAGELLAIRAVNQAAFPTPEEADLVDNLRTGGHVLVSLVAEHDGVIVGHALFSRMWIDQLPAVALAPVAVAPEHQRNGIGSRLIREGLDVLRQRDERIVLVLGHPDYYPRFGFSCDKAAAIEHPFPKEAFMALELAAGALSGVRGRVRYPAPFGI